MVLTQSQRDHQKRNSHCKADATDPYNLDARFVSNQLLQFDEALAEIQAGAKQSCWLWFVLPTAPHIKNGQEVGSAVNQHFALRSHQEMVAYLEFERKGINLRRNYVRMTQAIIAQLERGVTLLRLLGPLDVHKAMSSFGLFQKLGEERKDAELLGVCQKALDLVELDRQKREIVRIQSHNPKTYRHIMTL